MATPSPDDLQGLIQAAQSEVSKQEQQQQAQLSRRSGRSGAWRRYLALAVCAAAVAAWTPALRQGLPSDALVAADLATLVSQSRASVDAYRQRSGQLPAELPLPAVSTLVSYRLDAASPAGYVLEARHLGQRLRWPDTAVQP